MKPTKKSAPLKLTIDGDLADQIRAESRAQGCRPLTVVKQMLVPGFLCSDPTPEGQQFRRDMAARHVGITPELCDLMHERAKEAERASLARLRAGKPRMERVEVELPAEVAAKLERLAAAEGKTVNDFVVDQLDRELSA